MEIKINKNLLERLAKYMCAKKTNEGIAEEFELEKSGLDEDLDGLDPDESIENILREHNNKLAKLREDLNFSYEKRQHLSLSFVDCLIAEITDSSDEYYKTGLYSEEK